MQNSGQLYATDDDKRRLAPIYERIVRAGAANVQIRPSKRDRSELSDLKAACDLVLIDAPCSGTGAWRRNPDAKWRVRPGALQQRKQEQLSVLERSVALVKPGGRIVYVTCSVLDDENGAQVRTFRARHPEFSIVAPIDVAKALGDHSEDFVCAVKLSEEGILMTPRRTGTDGFFVSVMTRG